MDHFPECSCWTALHGTSLGRKLPVSRLERAPSLTQPVSCLKLRFSFLHHHPGRAATSVSGWGLCLAVLAGFLGLRDQSPVRGVHQTALRGDYDAKFGRLATELNKQAALGNVRKAEQVFKELEAHGIPANANLPRVTHNILLKAYAKRGDFTKAQRWMEKMKQKGIIPNMKGLGKLFASAAKSGDVAAVENMFRNVQQDDRASWNVLIDVYAKHGHWQKAIKSLRGMLQKDVKPIERDFSACINACAKAGRPDQATALLEDMSERALEPDVVTYTGLVNAYGGNLQMAEQTFRRMIEHTIEPDVAAYTSMINACAQAAKKKPSEALVLKAVAFAREMKSQCVAPNQYTYNCLINTLAFANYVDDARKLLQQKVDTEGVQLGPVAYTTILTAYKKAKRFDEAKRLFVEMQSRLTLRPEDWSAMIDCYAEAGKLGNALTAWDAMQNARLQPTLLTPQSILKAYVRRRDVEGAFAWLDSMPRRGFHPTPISYTIIAQGAATSSDMAERLVRHMAASRVQPNQWCENALVHKLGKERYSVLAAELKVKVGHYSQRRERNEADVQSRREKSLDRDRTKLSSKWQKDGDVSG